MRNLNRLFLISLVLTLIACEKSDDLNSNEIIGTYIGTITTDISSKLNTSKTVMNNIK